MADISSFGTVPNVLFAGSNVQSFIAGETIVAGQTVGMAATGVSMTVVAMDATAGEITIGVAINDATVGERIAVACTGCIAFVRNADDTTAVDAGELVGQNDNAVKGTVSACVAGAIAAGIALDDIAGGSYGKIMVMIVSKPAA